MLRTSPPDIESLEAISQNREALRLLLRLAEMSRAGLTGPFLLELAADGDLDDDTKGAVAELAADSSFLLAVEDYVRQTQQLH
jgi:hypothetical protein